MEESSANYLDHQGMTFHYVYDTPAHLPQGAILFQSVAEEIPILPSFHPSSLELATFQSAERHLDCMHIRRRCLEMPAHHAGC